jgi:hypothetical protein
MLNLINEQKIQFKKKKKSILLDCVGNGVVGLLPAVRDARVRHAGLWSPRMRMQTKAERDVLRREDPSPARIFRTSAGFEKFAFFSGRFSLRNLRPRRLSVYGEVTCVPFFKPQRLHECWNHTEI